MAPNNASSSSTQSEGSEENQDRNVLNRKSKNALNIKNSSEECVDENGNLIQKDTKDDTESYTYKIELAWFNIIGFIFLHYGWYLGFEFATCSYLGAFNLIYGVFTGFGITAGAHRLWAHGTYKAKLPVKLLLLYFQTAAFQNSVFEWVRDHRAHHKFTDTNADPHNASRGFFFSHMGWLMCKKHRDVKTFGKKVDMSDIESDPILAFQYKYYVPLMILCCFVIPVGVPVLWGEPLYNAFFLNMMRYVFVLHFTWLVNSFAHIWGSKPYDESIRPTETLTVAFFAFGEGFHNYHHVFPWDYKTSEHGFLWFNITTLLINIFAFFGQVSDLKTVPLSMIEKRALRTGDGTHKAAKILPSGTRSSKEKQEMEEHVWGWQDDLLSDEDRRDAKIINKT